MSLISPALYCGSLALGFLVFFHKAPPGKPCVGEQGWGEVFWGGVSIYGDCNVTQLSATTSA